MQENSNHSNEWQGCRTLVPAFAIDTGHPVSRRGYVENITILIFVFMLGARQNFFRKLAHKFGLLEGGDIINIGSEWQVLSSLLLFRMAVKLG